MSLPKPMPNERVHDMGLMRRIRNAILHRLQRIPDRIYAHRHPGPVARRVILLFAPLVLRFQPNDKWNLHVFVFKWMKTLQIGSRTPLPKSKHIFLFSAYRGRFCMDVVLATLLAWRGHRVTIGYLPMLQSPIKEPRIDHPSAKGYLAAALLRVGELSRGRIRCVDLTDGPCESTIIDEAYIEQRARYDTIMAMCRENLDLEDPECVANLEHYREFGRLAAKAARFYFDREARTIDLCIIPNGSTFSGTHVLKAAKAYGLPVNCFDKFSFRNIRLLNHGGHIRNFDDIAAVWSARGELGMDDEDFLERATDKALQAVNKRRSGSIDAWVTRPQQARSQGVAAVRQEIGVGPDEPLILVCTNVPFDAGYDALLTVFPSMRAWLVDTIRHLLKHSNKRIVLRAHPDEARWGGDETTERLVRDAGIDLSDVVLIPAEQSVNTYDLIGAADCGVVFSTTVGLEMAMLGKPVLVGSSVYYAGKGFTVDPRDADDYLALLARFGGDCTDFIPTAHRVQDAKLFHFLLHYAMQWPFPYDKPSGIERTPPDRLVARDCIENFIPTLDALSQTKEEWREALPLYLNASADNHMSRALQ